MRKLVSVLVILVIVFSVGISYATESSDYQTYTDEELQELAANIGNELKDRGYSVQIDIDKTSEVNNSVEIKLNQTVEVTDAAEFTITKIEYPSQVKPSHPDSYYLYYQLNDESNRFIDITTRVKNLTKNIADVSKLLNITVVYNNDYEYPTQTAIETSGGSSLTYANISGINPLSTATARYFVELPRDVVNDKANITVKINIDDKEYHMSGN